METWSIKTDEETKKELQRIQAEEGKEGKDFLKDILTAYKTSNLKDKHPLLTGDTAELKQMTNRMFEIYLNVAERFNTLTTVTEREAQELKETYSQEKITLEELISRQKEELKIIKEQLKEVQADRVNLENDLNTKVDQVNQVNQKNEALISEYKEKINTLTGLVNEFKGFKDEVTALKQEREQQKEANNELKDKLKEAEQEQEQTNKEILAQQQKHKEALESLKSKMVIECEKEALRVQKAQQDELQRVRDEYNTQLKELFSQLGEKEQPEPEQEQEQEQTNKA